MSDEAKNHGTPMAEQMDYLKRASTSERDQWDEQAERLLPLNVRRNETLRNYLVSSFAAEFRKRGQRIERLEIALDACAPLVCPHDQHTLGCVCACNVCQWRAIALARAASED